MDGEQEACGTARRMGESLTDAATIPERADQQAPRSPVAHPPGGAAFLSFAT